MRDLGICSSVCVISPELTSLAGGSCRPIVCRPSFLPSKKGGSLLGARPVQLQDLVAEATDAADRPAEGCASIACIK